MSGARTPGTGLPKPERKTLSTNPSAARDADETAQQRAQAEQFSVDVDAPEWST
jgi:hypothetical protein